MYISASDGKVTSTEANFVSYLETPPDYHIGDVLPQSGKFKPLSKQAMKNLNKLLTRDNSYIWLRIQFSIPEESCRTVTTI